ncbi:MAG: hypothetical protein ACKVT0_15570 [Planctomycetaceae bacterium]
MYGRVTLLGLFIVMFAGLWSSDQPTKRRDYLARHQSSRFLADRNRENRAKAFRPIQAVSQSTQSEREPNVHFANVSSDRSPVITSSAIPNDLSAGNYRVVNTTGTVLQIAVTHDWLKRENIPCDLPSREIYTRQTSTECWYWIRLDQKSTQTETAGLHP